MILHYLKVAVRNLLAHKAQTLISLFGLAIAFACVSLATYWNHYERTYDSFQENADRIFRIRYFDTAHGRVQNRTPYPLHLYLKENYPEVEMACAVKQPYRFKKKGANGYNNYHTAAIDDGPTSEALLQEITPEALEIFGFKWVEGNRDLMTYSKSQVAISEQLAKELCKEGSPLGKTLYINDRLLKFEVVGVYESRPKHSNVKFDCIKYVGEQFGENWSSLGSHTYVLLKEGVNVQHFIQKMQKDTVRRGSFPPTVFDIITPLSAMRQEHTGTEVNVAFREINLFSMSAVILLLCALLNYLTLFVSRLRARGRDMALRAICGSSAWQTSSLLLTEYLLLLLAASAVGMLLVELAMQEFMELAMIQIEFSTVMLSCGYLMLFSVVLSVLLSAVPILYFKRKTLRVQIEATSVRLGKNYFRSVAVCVQLVFGFLFIFCTAVMMKQVHMLIHTDNIERDKIAMVSAFKEEYPLVKSILQQEPYINTVLECEPLYPVEPFSAYPIDDWEGKFPDEQAIVCDRYYVNDEIAKFYGLKMKEGASGFELGENEVFINETLAKQMNMDNPVGKFIYDYGRIKGVIYDYQIQKPNTPFVPILYQAAKPTSFAIAFKYDGDWKDCQRKLLKAFQDKETSCYKLIDGEEFYRQYIKSEYNLLKLLGVITVVSILIAIFGIYALIMQSCDQHRKEIAIRKVYGAGVTDILMMFFKQYMMQVVVAAAIAFPIGYVLMKNWLEQYARQTEISIWIYLCIFLGISLLVTLCIGWRVWKAANENPAWVIKKE